MQGFYARLISLFINCNISQLRMANDERAREDRTYKLMYIQEGYEAFELGYGGHCNNSILSSLTKGDGMSVPPENCRIFEA